MVLFLDTGKSAIFSLLAHLLVSQYLSNKPPASIFLLDFVLWFYFRGKGKTINIVKFSQLSWGQSQFFPLTLYFYFHGAFDEMVYGFLLLLLQAFTKAARLHICLLHPYGMDFHLLKCTCIFPVFSGVSLYSLIHVHGFLLSLHLGKDYRWLGFTFHLFYYP